jgi:DNA-binding transcriptional MerR regulator
MSVEYKIGDISKYFHLSRQTIRYYEEQGLFDSRQDSKTGYRYYSYSEINLILEVTQLKQYGYSLEQMTDLSQKADMDQIDDSFREQQLILQAEVDQRQQALLRMSQTRDNIELIRRKLDDPMFEVSPSFVFQEFDAEGKNGGLKGDDNTLNLIQGSTSTPIGYKLNLEEDGQVKNYVWGFALPYVQEQFDPEKEELIEPHYSIHVIFDAGKEGQLSTKYRELVERLNEKYQFEVVGQPFGRILLRCHSDNSRQNQKRYFEVWIPIPDTAYHRYVD